MTKFILVFTLLISSFATAYTCSDIKKLNSIQRDTLVEAFLYGYPKDIGFTLAAIVWKESSAGLWKINISDPSAGIAHNHLKYSLIRLGIKDTSFNRNVLAQRLVDNNQLSLSLAVEEIEYWFDRHNGNWQKTRASYNQGNHWASQNGTKYSKDVLDRLRILKDCGTFSAYQQRF